MNQSLLIAEPPLQVLPSLAAAIGLNEALVLQQMHYLTNSGNSGRVIGGERWVFDTYEELQRKFFPFWSVDTIQRTIGKLEKAGWLLSCQPEGSISRRKYYRLGNQAYIHLTTDRLKQAKDSGKSRTPQFAVIDVADCGVPLAETSAKNSEHREHTPARGAGLNDSKKSSSAQRPEWPAVILQSRNMGHADSIARHFWLTNEHYGWTIRGRPMHDWKKALTAFAKVDAFKSQKLDKMCNDEFWAWANSKFDEDQIEHVHAWVRVSAKNEWQKKHRITGEMEPIGDFRAACTAFVDECEAMKIIR